jgi:RNA polymerase sigma factor
LVDSFSQKGKKDTFKAMDFENDIILTVKKIKDGDKYLREEFINKYKPYIINTVSNITHKYIDTENSDEFSVGLSAFNEAIDCFDDQKNSHFFKFSTLVIKRRLTDFARRNKKHCNVYPFTYFEDKNNSYFEELNLKTEIDMHTTFEITKEINLFRERLHEFGISLNDLVNSAPKHKDSKSLCIRIAKVIADDSKLFGKLVKSRNIPKTDLLKAIKINKKTIERNRKFIIAASLIFGCEFYLLKDFIDITEIGGDDFEQRTK